MRALVLTDLRRVEVLDRPAPQPAADEVVLDVSACGICGSDVHGFLGEEPRRQPGLCLGHECVGRIASPHPSLARGTRVAVNPLRTCGACAHCLAGRTNQCPHRRLIGLDQVPGAFAEQVAVPAAQVFALPDSVPDELACLCEPLACCVHLMGLAGGPPFARTALYGGGTMGLMTVVVAVRLGYRVTVIEPSAGRRRIALALGAEAALDPREAAEPGALGEVELALDCTGVAAARAAAVRQVNSGGTVLLLGTTDTATELDWRDLVRRELRLQASYGFTADEFKRALGLLRDGAVAVAQWVPSYPLGDGQTAFESLVGPPGEVVKVVLKPGV